MTSIQWDKRLERISTFYDDLVQQYGHTPRACDYGRSESQLRKFKVLSEAMPLTGKRVLDVGCGFADFADFLRDKYKDLVYEGVDIAPAMIQAGRRLHPDLTLRMMNIMEDDPGGPYDLVTANGIFYLLGDNAEEAMRALIQRMYELSSYAVAFNSLSAWADRKEPGEFYADPLAMVKFCRTLARWVVLRHDYMPHDFTIYMYREAHHE